MEYLKKAKGIYQDFLKKHEKFSEGEEDEFYNGAISALESVFGKEELEDLKPNFTTPGFIENTPEMTAFLDTIGYTKSDSYIQGEPILWTSGRFYYSTSYKSSYTPGENIVPYGVCCLGCPSLFKAVVALREDYTDSYQWFTDGKEQWEMTEENIPSRYMQMEGHKASISELIEHFLHG